MLRLKIIVRRYFSSSVENTLRKVYLAIGRLRCVIKALFSSNRVTIYHASIQKTGSSWICDVLSDSRMFPHLGIPIFPQGRYEWGGFLNRFPVGSYVPGLFISYQLFEEINKPKRYKAFYVMRDPRAVLVSWYFSARDTHFSMGRVEKDRAVLQSLTVDEGVRYSIDQLSLKFEFMRSWANLSVSDENIKIIKFENLTQNSLVGFSELFEFLDVKVKPETLKIVLEEFGLEKMKKKDENYREAIGNAVDGGHYSGKGKDWRSVVSDTNLAYFYARTGDLMECLGYEK